MTDHSARADELAAQANRALQETLAKFGGGGPRNALVSHEDEMAAWATVHALQAQAQIHATLAMNDNLSHLW
ncbi:hypothetical protein ACFQZZ_33275 [Nocardia sp. GCM10030253]|uniref:hypothetical protein n=1 Tax=Nocardia sp. GCM10030253 TaxID=3273404 RepID=UPI00362AB5FB